MGVGLFSQVSSDKMRENSLQLCQERLRLDTRENVFTERVARESGSPGYWRNHHPWNCSKKAWMWHLGVWLSGDSGGVGLTAGLNDLRALFQSY